MTAPFKGPIHSKWEKNGNRHNTLQQVMVSCPHGNLCAGLRTATKTTDNKHNKDNWWWSGWQRELVFVQLGQIWFLAASAIKLRGTLRNSCSIWACSSRHHESKTIIQHIQKGSGRQNLEEDGGGSLPDCLWNSLLCIAPKGAYYRVCVSPQPVVLRE